MNISGVSVTVDSTGHLVGSTLTEIPIHENDVTAVLTQRWIACYMLYDWNPTMQNQPI